jgi:methyl-accepting chemotaxis protein
MASPSPLSSAAEALLDGLGGAMALAIDSSGTLLRASPNLLQQLELNESAVIGKPLAGLLPELTARSSDYRSLIKAVFDGSLASTVVRFGNGANPIQACLSFHRCGSGAEAQAVAVVNALPASATAANGGSDGLQEMLNDVMLVVEYTPDGSITSVNGHGLSLLGYQHEELLGKREDVLLTTTVFDSEKCQQKWADLREGKAVVQQCHFYAQDGSDVFIEAHYLPICDMQTHASKVVMMGCDVSPTEKRLRKAFAMMEKKSMALNEALQEAREAHRMREEMDRALQAMATPVTPIWDEVLLLPLVGIIDSTRTDDAMKTTLDKISQTGAKMFILDISGVPSVDTAVANQLIKITKATRIMGCETIVSGVSSAIAHTIVELGIDIGEMITTSSLRDAVSMSLDRVGGPKPKKKDKKQKSGKHKNDR